MASSQRVSRYGGQLGDRTIADGDIVPILTQRRFNNQAHIPPKTNYISQNAVGSNGDERGIGKSYNTRGLSWTRGMSPSLQTKTGLTIATGMVPVDKDEYMGGSLSSTRILPKDKTYGYSDRIKNLTGMNPLLLGVSNFELYEKPLRHINKDTDSYRIERANSAPSTSLASRLKRVGGTIR